MVAVQVDSKYRVMLPREVRDGIQPGDVLFVERGEEGVIHYAKAENPFDALARHAIEEHRRADARPEGFRGGRGHRSQWRVGRHQS